MTEKKKVSCLAVIGVVCLLLLVYLPLSIALGGYTISKFWLWFVSPVFLVNPLSITNAIGLSFFIGIFTVGLARKHDLKDPDDERSALQKIAGLFIESVLTWVFLFGLGYLMHVLFPASSL